MSTLVFAAELKDKGNKAYSRQDYQTAVEFYSDGLAELRDMQPLYTNRAQVNVQMPVINDSTCWRLGATSIIFVSTGRCESRTCGAAGQQEGLVSLVECLVKLSFVGGGALLSLPQGVQQVSQSSDFTPLLMSHTCSDVFCQTDLSQVVYSYRNVIRIECSAFKM